MTYPDPADIAAGRRATVRRAIDLIDSAGPADVAAWLAQTRVHAHLQADPAALRGVLADCADDHGARLFGAWKAAQQLLQAAGLPY